MNYDYYKAASEATDADERALIPGFKRMAHRCPNCDVLIASGKQLCHPCQLEAQHEAIWDEKRETDRDLEYESRLADEREASGYRDNNEGDQ